MIVPLRHSIQRKLSTKRAAKRGYLKMNTLTKFVIALLISSVLAFNGLAASAGTWQDKKDKETPKEQPKKDPPKEDKKDKRDDKKKPDGGF
jgi:hypothetical protein